MCIKRYTKDRLASQTERAIDNKTSLELTKPFSLSCLCIKALELRFEVLAGQRDACVDE